MIKEKVKTCGAVLLIPVEDILPPEIPNRKIILSDELEGLAQSIRQSGIITPLTVSFADNGCYRIIAGERRRQAAIMCGIKYLPCIVINADNINSLVLSLVADIHIQELHFLELASAIEKLRDFMSVEDISDILSIPQGMVLSRIRLLNLPENIKWKIISGNIDEKTANAISRVDEPKRQNEITELIINNGLSFKEAYEYTDVHNKKTVFMGHFKDYKIFENTIEHAVETMTASGISAKIRKLSDDNSIEYVISINKLI